MIDVVVIDGNSYAHRVGNVMSLVTHRGEETSVSFGMLNMIRVLIERNKPKEVCVCWDYKGSQSKKELYPEYKKRPHKEGTLEIYKMVNQQILELYEILPSFGIKQLRIAGIEADDLIGIIAQYLGNTRRTLVVSSDHDLWQLVAFPGIKVYHPQKDLTLSSENFEEKVGFKPEMWVWFRSIMGDTGDNIKGLKWFGEKTARELLAKFGPWTNWWGNILQGNETLRPEILACLNKRQKESILAPDACETLTISYALTKVGMLDIRRSPEIIKSYDEQTPKFDEEAIKGFFFTKEFNSILARFRSWIHPFRMMTLHEGLLDEKP